MKKIPNIEIVNLNTRFLTLLFNVARGTSDTSLLANSRFNSIFTFPRIFSTCKPHTDLPKNKVLGFNIFLCSRTDSVARSTPVTNPRHPLLPPPPPLISLPTPLLYKMHLKIQYLLTVAITSSQVSVQSFLLAPQTPSTHPIFASKQDFLENSPYWSRENVPVNTYKNKTPFIGKVVRSVRRRMEEEGGGIPTTATLKQSSTPSH